MRERFSTSCRLYAVSQVLTNAPTPPSRQKKKARLDELEEIETRYLSLKRRETLNNHRRRHIVEFVENVNVKADQKCRLAVKLIRLVERQLSNPELAVLGEIALSSGDVAMAHVSARGNVANESKTMTGVVSASFRPGATELQDLSICLTDLPISDSSLNAGALFPSVVLVHHECSSSKNSKAG